LPEHKESGDLLEEESFDEPMIQAESAFELSEVQDEVAKLRPQLELAAENARKSAVELRQSLCDQQKKVRELTREQREQLRQAERQLKRQMEQMSQKLRNYLDI